MIRGIDGIRLKYTVVLNNSLASGSWSLIQDIACACQWHPVRDTLPDMELSKHEVKRLNARIPGTNGEKNVTILHFSEEE